MTQSPSFAEAVALARRVAAGFDAVQRRRWGAEGSMIELVKQVGDLARHVMVAERYYLADRDQDPAYATTRARIRRLRSCVADPPSVVRARRMDAVGGDRAPDRGQART